MFVMISSLTKNISHLSCRLFLWLPTGSTCGLIYSRRICARTWILGATA
jgi:hypothetical protein